MTQLVIVMLVYSILVTGYIMNYDNLDSDFNLLT